jgi:hypothetical protein
MSDEHSIRVDLSADGASLTAFIPSLTVEGGHHVNIPLDLRGLVIMYDILKARHDAREDAKKIGSRSSPTDALVREWLKNNKPTKQEPIKSRKLQKLEAEIADIEIEGLEIEL